jgi:hypothetical protein
MGVGRRTLGIAAACASCAALLGGAVPAAPKALGHEAYIWQRQWRPALIEAVSASRGHLQRWRVLAAQAGAAGKLVPVVVPHQALRASGRPVVMVVRIEGSLRLHDAAHLVREVVALRHRWAADGAAPVMVEIDHDAGTAALPAYAAFLAQLRSALDGLPLSITALPAWMDSPVLSQVLAEADESVLQVHAVQHPSRGLFDASRARGWVQAWSRRSDKPFFVALPCYGAAVTYDKFGNLRSVEGEVPRLAGDASSGELMALPSEVSGLLGQLQRDGVRGLRGVAWFRLPTSEDRRAWSQATWHAVLRGQPLRGRAELQLRAAGHPGTFDLVLVNAGPHDAELPRQVDGGMACTAADGANGYVAHPVGAAPAVRRKAPGLLRSGQEQVIGWLRCADAKEAKANVVE